MNQNRYNKILVIKHGSLGDIVFSFKAMNSIRQNFKNSEITLITENKFNHLLHKSNYFDKIFNDNRKGVFLSIILIFKILFSKYDLIIDLQNSKRTNLYNFFLKHFSNAKISSSRKNAHFQYIIPSQGLESPSQGLINQLKLINVAPSEDKYDWLRCDTSNIPNENLILIIPGVSKSGIKKKWPSNNFAELSKILEDKGFTICVIGQEVDRDSTKLILSKCKNAIDMTNLSPPEVIFSIAEKSLLIISNDTGPGHLAALSKKNILWLALDNFISKANLVKYLNSFYIFADNIDEITVGEVIAFIKKNQLI